MKRPSARDHVFVKRLPGRAAERRQTYPPGPRTRRGDSSRSAIREPIAISAAAANRVARVKHLEVRTTVSFNPKRNHANRSDARRGLAAVAVGAALVTVGVGSAFAADVRVLDREGQLERSLEIDDTRQRYSRLFEEAKRLDVEPERNLATGLVRGPVLGVQYAALTADVAKAQAKEKIKREEKPEFGTPESVGVSRSTLDSIATCESGGDPTIVDASGTYHGKYQFDVGTWASVGGSGLPSAAPEAEQDYRAALLYSQAGATPWPVCG